MKYKMETMFLHTEDSDLTISFPGHDITYPVHRSVLTKTTPYFQNLLDGPLCIHGHQWSVRDEHAEPEAFKIILGHCYGVEIITENVDVALRVYKLTDLYMMDRLKEKCFNHLIDFVKSDPVNAEQLLKFSYAYNFLDLKSAILTCLSKIHKRHNKYVMFSNLLLNLYPEWRDEILSQCGKITELSFTESWMYPKYTLPYENISPILQSINCQEPGLGYFSGCVSAKVLREITWKNASYNMLSLSLCDSKQAEELASALPDMREDWYFYLHIPYKAVSPESFNYWPEVTRLFLA
ncbi:unnamed protein product, partial [Meganyctiphanes norvegica]